MLSRARLNEAKALLAAGLADGAYYLAGYTVEFALKACIAKGTRKYEFPEKKKVDAIHTHKLRDLVRVAGLEEARRVEARNHPTFRANWDVVELWSIESRYDKHRLESARALIEAIGGRNHGVISWIRLHW